MLQLKVDPERNVYHELKNFFRIERTYRISLKMIISTGNQCYEL